jgi:hypothetical protein
LSLGFESDFVGAAVGVGVAGEIALGEAEGAGVAVAAGVAVTASPGLVLLVSVSVVQAANVSDIASAIKVFLSIFIHPPVGFFEIAPVERRGLQLSMVNGDNERNVT